MTEPLATHTAPVSLRLATPADAGFLALLYQSVRAPQLQEIGWGAPQIEAFCAMQLRLRNAGHAQYTPRPAMSVISHRGVPVGRIDVVHNKPVWLLVNIELLPGSRGQGIGGSVIRGLQRRAAAAGAGVALHVDRGNPAQRLYERCGFAPVAVSADNLQQYMRWSGDALIED